MRSLSLFRVTLCRCLLFAVLVATSACASAKQTAPIAFRHIGMESGLTHERVSSVCSGSNGILWVSTLWGIDSYDGSTVSSFSVPDSILRGGEVYTLQEFGPDSMLVRMSSGLAFFRRSLLSFTRADEYLKASGVPSGMTDIYTDHHQNLWMVGGDSVLFVPKGGKVISFPLPRGVQVSCTSPSQYGFSVLLVDGRVIRCAPPAQGCAPSPQVFATPIPSGGKVMRTDDFGDLWVISQKGDSLWHKSMVNSSWELVNDQRFWTPDIPKDLVDVAVDSRRRIWLVSDQNGAVVIDPSDGDVTILKRDASTPFCLRSNLCTCVRTFPSGSVVIGYQHSGFSLYHPAAFKFAPLVLAPSTSQYSISDVRSITFDGRQHAYVGSNAGGVIKVDIDTRVASRVPFAKDDIVETMSALPDGSLWASISGRGFARYNPSAAGSPITYFAERRDSPDPLSGNTSSGALTYVHDGCLWVAAARQILAMPNILSGGDIFKGCAVASFEDEVVTMRRCSDSTSVIVLTRSTIYKATLTDGNIAIAKYADYDFRGDRPSDLCQGIYGFLWVATARGVVVFGAPDSTDHVHLLKQVELAQPAISLATCARGGGLAATASEVCLFKVFRRSDGDYRIVMGHYNASSGLLPGANSPRATLLLPSGQVWIGAEGGVNIYDPSLDDETSAPMVSFTSLFYNGHVVIPGQKIGGVVPLEQSVPSCASISLPTNAGVFSVSMSVRGASSPKCYSYLCEVVGSGQPPVMSLEPSFIIPSLPEGSYTLRVKAVDPEDRESDSPAEIKVNVYVPWHASRLVRCIFFVLLVVGVVALVIFIEKKRRHVRALERENLASRDSGLTSFNGQPSASTDIESIVIKSVAANVATSIDVLTDDIRALSDTRGLPLTDSIAIRNLVYRLISANSALAAVAGTQVADESDGRPFTGRHDIVAAARTTVRQVATITHSTQSVGFSSTLRNSVFEFDADAFRAVLIDIMVDAVVSTAGRGFVRVLVEKGKYGADLVSVSVCIGGELPTTSPYFNAGGTEPALPVNIEACVRRLNATVCAFDFGDGLLYTFIHIPVGK